MRKNFHETHFSAIWLVSVIACLGILLFMSSIVICIQEAPAIAVMQFQNKSGSAQYWDTSKGWELADQIRNALTESGNYQGIEASNLQKIVMPEALKGDRLTPAIEAELLKKLGATYILYGIVTKWSVEVVKTNVGVPGAQVSSESAPEANVEFKLTLVDAETSKVVKSFIAKGHAEGTGTVGITGGSEEVKVKGTDKLPVIQEAQNLAIKDAITQLTDETSAEEETSKLRKGKTGRSSAKKIGETESAAEAVIINDNDQERTIDCKGTSITINSNDNTLTLRGHCRKVLVNGNHNTLKIEAVGTINVNGNYNVVKWKSGMGGKQPAIINPGNQNTIYQEKKIDIDTNDR